MEDTINVIATEELQALIKKPVKRSQREVPNIEPYCVYLTKTYNEATFWTLKNKWRHVELIEEIEGNEDIIKNASFMYNDLKN